MNPSSDRQQMSVKCGVAGAALDGEQSGDLEVVVTSPERTLVALIDGLGHGPEAALAAREAARVLRADAAQPIDKLISRCHEALHSTRGVVMTLVAFDMKLGALQCCGVGNVEGMVFHADPAAPLARHAIATRGGVVGHRLPPLTVATERLWPGDLLVLATDGVRSDFSSAVRLDEADPQAIALSLLSKYGKPTDDALVLVARYTRSEP